MDAFIGTICAFGFNYAPYQWAMCQGQILPIQSNTALFSLLGTAYGGNGTSTFGLPNLVGKVANGQGSNGQSSYVMGETGGNDNVTVLGSNLPIHNHTITTAIKTSTATSGGIANPANAFPGSSAGLNGTKIYSPAATTGTFMGSPTVTLGNTGGTTPISVQDPGLVMTYCISLVGYFPTRN